MVPARESRRTAPAELTRSTRWLLALQALALVAGALAIVVLTATSHADHSAGFIAVDVVGTVLLAALLTVGARKRWARTPVIMVELIAVLISFQIWSSGRGWVALLVGIPAAIALVLLLLANRAH